MTADEIAKVRELAHRAKIAILEVQFVEPMVTRTRQNEIMHELSLLDPETEAQRLSRAELLDPMTGRSWSDPCYTVIRRPRLDRLEAAEAALLELAAQARELLEVHGSPNSTFVNRLARALAEHAAPAPLAARSA